MNTIKAIFGKWMPAKPEAPETPAEHEIKNRHLVIALRRRQHFLRESMERNFQPPAS